MAMAAAADGVRISHQPSSSSSSCKSSLPHRRHGKKMSMPELRAAKESLIEEQMQLRMELAKQEEIYGVLLEQNTTLKHLKAGEGGTKPLGVDRGEVNVGRPQLVSTSPSGTFPFDLNCLPDDDS